jgi:hypothetical protein
MARKSLKNDLHAKNRGQFLESLRQEETERKGKQLIEQGTSMVVAGPRVAVSRRWARGAARVKKLAGKVGETARKVAGKIPGAGAAGRAAVAAGKHVASHKKWYGGGAAAAAGLAGAGYAAHKLLKRNKQGKIPAKKAK